MLEYLGNRRAWEIEAAELDRRGDEAAFWAGYDRLLSRFITPDLIQQGLDANSGNPTDIDPAFTTVLRTTTAGDTAVVSTHEAVREVVEADYEYRLRLVGGEWRLKKIDRTRGPDGKWIKYVL